MAEIIENTSHNCSGCASNSKGNAALTTGIIGTSLGAIALMGMGNNGGLLGSLFGGRNTNSDKSNEVTSMTAEDLYIERDVCNKYIDITKQYYEGKLDGNRQLTDAFFQCYERDVKNSFDLYKLGRDNKDELNDKINAVDKKVDMMMAIRPYQDALINAQIDKNALIADYNLSRRTCRMIQGELVLPSTPTVTGYASYSVCPCNQPTSGTTTA